MSQAIALEKSYYYLIKNKTEIKIIIIIFMVLELVIPTKTFPVEMRLDISMTSPVVVILLFVCFPAAWCNIMTSSMFMMTKNKQVSYS